MRITIVTEVPDKPKRKTRGRSSQRIRVHSTKHFEGGIPKGTHLDGAYNSGKLKRCELQRNGLGPIKGHCEWCDMLLAKKSKKSR